MSNFIKDNQELIVLTAVVTALFLGVAALSIGFRGGQPWAYAKHSSLIVMVVLSSLLTGAVITLMWNDIKKTERKLRELNQQDRESLNARYSGN